MEQPQIKTKQNHSKINIAFVTNVGYSLFHEEIRETYGGGQIDLYLLAKELRQKQNYGVAMIFLDYGQPSEEYLDGIRLIKSYHPRRPGQPVRQFITACCRLWDALRRANADIYFHEGAEFEIAVTRIFCFIKKRKYVFRCANIIDVDGQYHKKNPLHGRLFSFGLSGANAYIAQTKDQERLLKKTGKHINIIENMYPIHTRPIAVGDRIAWIGRLTRVKRPDVFLRLAKAFPSLHFLMLGPVDTVDREYARNIQLQAQKIKNLQYIEKIPFQRTREIFDQVRLLINTSEYEGFPMTFVQAMCQAIPILTIGIDPDQVVSGVAGYVARDERDLAEKFTQLLNQNAWERHSHASYEYAKKYFAPDVIIPKYEALFKSVLEK